MNGVNELTKTKSNVEFIVFRITFLRFTMSQRDNKFGYSDENFDILSTFILFLFIYFHVYSILP